MDNKFSTEAIRKYVGVKPKGLDHYLWFESTKTVLDGESFAGRDGWGKGGNLTNVWVKLSEIDSVIHSDTLHMSY